MKITILLHDDLDYEQSELLTKFVEAVAAAGGAITVEGGPLQPLPEPWKITPAGLTGAEVDPPAISYDLGGPIATRLVETGASKVRPPKE